MNIKLASPGDAVALSHFYLRNEEHLLLWQPLREPGYHTKNNWKQRLTEWQLEQDHGNSAYFIAQLSEESEIFATCYLTNIVRGVFQACHMGYAIDYRYEGKGYMRQLCQYVIQYAFKELKLNRIMANYMPNNLRSENLLTRLGFDREGLAKRYLKINGRWEDHVLTTLVNPENVLRLEQ